MGQIKKETRRFFVMLCSQAAILYSKYQFLSDSARVHPSVIASISTIMDPAEGKGVNLSR